MSISSHASELMLRWIRRLHLTAAVLVVWAALHYGVGFFVPRGSHRPAILFGYEGGALAAILVAAILLGGSALTRLLAGERPAALTVAGLALALWAFPFGTMDDWLKDRHPAPAGPTSGPYLLLIGEYLYFGVLLLAVAAVGGHLTPRALSPLTRRPGDPGAPPQTAAGAESAAARRRPWSNGVLVACISSVVAAAILWLLSGPRVGATYRLQVYFAVAVAFYVSTAVAWRITGTREPASFWPAPLIVGLTGVLWAALHPTLPAPYDHLNMIPALPLARPLPVEMLSVGLLAVLAALRSVSGAAVHRQGGR